MYHFSYPSFFFKLGFSILIYFYIIQFFYYYFNHMVLLLIPHLNDIKDKCWFFLTLDLFLSLMRLMTRLYHFHIFHSLYFIHIVFMCLYIFMYYKLDNIYRAFIHIHLSKCLLCPVIRTDNFFFYIFILKSRPRWVVVACRCFNLKIPQHIYI